MSDTQTLSLLLDESTTAVFERAAATMAGSLSPAQDAAAATIVVASDTVQWQPSDHLRTLIVAGPTPALGPQLLTELEQRDCAVLEVGPWADNPALATARDWMRDSASPARLETTVSTPASGRHRHHHALYQQITAVENLVGTVTDLTLVTASDTGYIAFGHAGALPVTLSLAATSAVPESFTARLHTDEGAVTIAVPSWQTSRPAAVTRIDPQGEHSAPSVYETAARAVLQKALATGGFAGAREQAAARARRSALATATLTENPAS